MYADWLKGRMQLSPNKIAVIEPEKDKQWAYKELNNRAENLALYLLRNGIEKGDRVAISSPNDISVLDFLFASAKIGAVFIPLNWRLKEDEIARIIEDSKPKLIAYSTDHVDRLSKAPHDLLNINVDSEEYNEIVQPQYAPNFDSLPVNKEDPAVLIYTSGTTGKPKGAMISHKMLGSNGLYTMPGWNLTSEDRTVTSSPMFHTAGLFGLVIPLLIAGGQVVIQRYFNVEPTYDLIQKYQATIMFMVPTMYYNMAKSPLFSKEALSSVRLFVSGGAPLNDFIFNAFKEKELPLINSYGLTEVGPNNFYIDPSEAIKRKSSVGKPILFSKVQIVDEQFEAVKPGEVGEILISGDHTFSGYWKNEEETKKAFWNNFVRTGDLARIDEEGYYYIVGRKKEMIITGGENVYPSEVEEVLNSHPNVQDAVVVGYPNDKWGESVAAAIILNEKTEDIEEELDSYSNSKLAGYKTPKAYLFVEDFPETPVGKINKQELVDRITNKVVLN